MKKTLPGSTSPATQLPKCPTGIQGLDEITGGGLPRGRPTLVCGGAGCGKTLLAAEFLVRGAVQFGEPGVFMAFEETDEELKANVASLGFDLAGLVRRKQMVLDHIHIERSEITETGEYDLEALFVRLNHAINSIGAKRVVLDTLEALFAGLPNEAILRAELRRLFRWLKDKGVTAVITAERGREQLTRHGLEEYVSDCVILLEHRVFEQIATRHMRVVKYRGALHGTNGGGRRAAGCHEGPGAGRLRHGQKRRARGWRLARGTAPACGQGNRPGGQAGRHPFRRGAAQDALGQDHAPSAQADCCRHGNQGRHNHARRPGRARAPEPC